MRTLLLSAACAAALAPAAHAATYAYTLTLLGDLPGGRDDSRAYAINDAGQVVGSSSAATGTRAFLWENGSMTDLGDLPGGSDSSSASAINEAGQVVGTSDAATGRRAFLWQNGAVTDLGDLPGGADSSFARGINNAGQVVGYSSAANGLRAFLWDKEGGMIDLGAPQSKWSSNFSIGLAINDAGQVVGSADFPARNQTDAFLWDKESGFTNLGILGRGGFGYPGAINDAGQVVGEIMGVEPPAFLWQSDTGMIALNDLIDPSLGWIPESASDINNKGQIVGSAWNGDSLRAYLLTPVATPSVPLPASLPLVAAGFGALALAARRHRAA